MVHIIISLTLFVVSFSKPIPSEKRCNKINKCYNPITQRCDYLAPCAKQDYCNDPLFSSCPAYPSAQCQFTGCGGCNTYFIDEFNQIIRNCDADICSFPAEPGFCRGAFPRYYFNDETQQCEQFIYGGCGGNANNFQTLEDCENSCNIDICSLPSDSGVCQGAFPRFFHNDITDQCEEFIYGGCEGNDNNFKTLCECQQTCNDLPDCVPKGGSFMGDPKTCTLIDFVCAPDEDYWFDNKCGCGCKPKKIDNKPDCVPEEWSFVGVPKQCMVMLFFCAEGTEHWSLPECGCGCKPKEDPTICQADVKQCSDGSFVSRDPLNNCRFKECPKCNKVQCLVEPCEFSWCDNYPDATCSNNYCGGCVAIWTDSNGNDVTNQCYSTTTTTIKPTCVPDQSWTFVGDNELCSRIFFVCGDGQEYWSKPDCGCGCKPKVIFPDCKTGGCSGQVCAENGKNVMSTCEWKCEYGCRKLHKTCGRGTSDTCGWYFSDDASEEAYNQCVSSCDGAIA